MTVTVETPEGVKQGSTVREISAGTGLKLWSEGSSHSKITRGEAAVVDLGNKGPLFAVLKVDPIRPLSATFPTKGALTRKGLRYYSNLRAGPTQIGDTAHPSLFRFQDMNDPSSIELVYKLDKSLEEGVDEYIPVDNFEKIYGAGYKLKSVTIEMTDDRPTEGIIKWLPWLPKYKNKKFGERSKEEISDGIFDTPAEFSAGYFIVPVPSE